MRKKLLFVTSFALFMTLLLACGSAFADSPVGSWSGTAKALGQSGGASATFKSNGSVSLSAAGVTGSGTWSGGSISISAKGHTASLSYSQNGDSMTISGKYMGVKASMSLSRKGGSGKKTGSESKVNLPKKLIGEWVNGDTETIRLYSDGWFYYTSLEVEQDADNEEEWFTFIAKVSAKDGVMTLSPLETLTDAPEEGPFAWDDEADAYKTNYKVDGSKLTLTSGDYSTNFDKSVIKLDAKPSDPEFIPYVELMRGDKGEAVRLMQQALIESGYLEGDADGAFGPKTLAAVNACQEVFGMERTKTANGEFMTMLYEHE